ncbi:TPA: hypothetical protein EYP37_02030 [Candidatus Poribacteria bacterium]|nr:hypothetical protein [Candidatus Poribacteria bacterium]
MITIDHISTLLRLLLSLLIPFVLVSCALHPPVDYYYEFALMERLGEEIRAQTGREIGVAKADTVQSIKPLSLPFQMDEAPTVSLISRTSQGEASGVAEIPFAPDMLRKFLSENQGINVSRVELINGRAKGGRNVVRVSFLPKSLTDEELLAEYLIICAAVRGFDKEYNSVDTVVGLIEDENTLIPYIALQSDVKDYIDLEGGRIGYRDWTSRVEVKSLREK